jgi:hypothetical protein
MPMWTRPRDLVDSMIREIRARSTPTLNLSNAATESTFARSNQRPVEVGLPARRCEIWEAMSSNVKTQSLGEIGYPNRRRLFRTLSTGEGDFGTIRRHLGLFAGPLDSNQSRPRRRTDGREVRIHRRSTSAVISMQTVRLQIVP